MWAPTCTTPSTLPRLLHPQLGRLVAQVYLMAEVANTCPLEPTQRTTMEARTTMRSGGRGGTSPARPLAQGKEPGGQKDRATRMGRPAFCLRHTQAPLAHLPAPIPGRWGSRSPPTTLC